MELASICRRAHTELEGTAILSRSRGRDRWFESTFLQRRVSCELFQNRPVSNFRGRQIGNATSWEKEQLAARPGAIKILCCRRGASRILPS